MAIRQGIPLEALDKQEREIDAEIERLTMKRDTIRALRALAVTFPNSNGYVPTAKPPTLTDTVVEWVAKHPGQTSAEIRDGILGTGMKIGGADASKTLLTTIGAVVTKDRIRKDGEGKHWPL